MSSQETTKRILVVGGPATGKSDAAKRIGLIAGLPVHHLDALYWRPGWVDQNEQNWTAKLDELTAGDAWVLDGNFLPSLPQRIARAHMILWLDYSREETVKRVLARMIFPQPMPRDDLAEGCVESFDFDVLTAAWRFSEAGRKQLETMLSALTPTQILIRIERPKDLNYFLNRYSARVKLR